MKIKSPIILSAFAATILIWSCAKDSLENTYPGNTSSNGALADFLAQNAPPLQTFTFNAGTGSFFQGAGGTNISVAPNAFLYPNNQPVSGTVTMNLREVYGKKDIITSGGFTSASGLILISDGEIYLDAWQGSQELHLASNTVVSVQMPSATNSTQPMYEFYAQDISETSDFVQASPAVAITAVADSFGSILNSFNVDQLHWINCDYFGSYAGDRTNVKATPAPIWNSNNCMALMSINGTLSVISMYYDPTYDAFIAYGIPVDLDVTIICIAEIRGNFYFQEIQTTTVEEQNVSLTPTLTPEADINQFLENLE